ncbi:M16 family metallopeptidase [Roseospirillum parvum]|uniref:Zinc protease n=1 Tax=Roseospirillum parvum TaxID=83401 RepID=A0A1G8EEV5_9PROT|nr:pitrilysin family protein [Roseospirillum parvum]SDH68405.1 zinc protease [Roseospirillum parvum]
MSPLARRLTLLALVILPLALPSPARAEVFGAETATLKNGLQVVVVPNHRGPVIHHMVWYKVGAADEPPGKSGLAHLLEHLMFKGTEKVPAGEFSKIVARNGGRDNAFTGSDYTAYHQTIARDRLPLVMELEADRLANLRLAEEDFQTERQVVLEERLSRVENEPAALLAERLDLALWVTHPYRNPVIGWEDEIKALTRTDALAFHAAHYAPNNAILVVAGDVTLDEVLPLAEKFFGPIPAAEVAERTRPERLPPPARATIEMAHPRVAQASFRRLYPAPAASDPTGDTPALEVLGEILGGGGSSRLYRRLVVDDAVATTAGLWVDPHGRDYATVGLYGRPRPPHTLNDLEAAMDAEISRLLADGVSAEEVAGAIDKLTARVAYARDDLATGAEVLGRALATGSTVAEVEAWPERIAEVTPQRVMAVARAVLGGERAVTGLLRPAASAPETSAPEARQ